MPVQRMSVILAIIALLVAIILETAPVIVGNDVPRLAATPVPSSEQSDSHSLRFSASAMDRS